MNNSYNGGRRPPNGYQGYGGPPQAPYYVPPNPYKRPVRRNANIAAGGLILMELVSVAVSYLIVYTMAAVFPVEVRANMGAAMNQILSIIVYVIAFGLPIALMVVLIRIPVRVAFPIRRTDPRLVIPAIFFCLGVTMAGGFIANTISYFCETFFGTSSALPDGLNMPHRGTAIFFYFIAVAILPPILEEMLFRGVIMQSLRRFGDGFALVVSALLFAFCHGNLVQAPPAFLSGLAFGYFVLRSGSLSVGILIHFVNNAFAVAMEYVSYYGSDEALLVANGLFFICYLLLPIVALIYLLAVHPRMFRTIPSQYPLMESHKYLLFFTSGLPIIYVIMTVFNMALSFA